MLEYCFLGDIFWSSLKVEKRLLLAIIFEKCCVFSRLTFCDEPLLYISRSSYGTESLTLPPKFFLSSFVWAEKYFLL